MRMTVTSWLGAADVVERFAVALPEGLEGELRWGAHASSDAVDAPQRVRDATTFHASYPHPLVPEVLGTVTSAEGMGMLTARVHGPTLAELCGEPLPPEAAFEVCGRLAEYLLHLSTLRDPRQGRFPVSLRGLSAQTVRLSADGHVWVCTHETIGGDWPGRQDRTRGHARPSEEDAEFLSKGPAEDLFDFGLVALRVAAGAEWVDRLTERIDDADGAAMHSRVLTEVLGNLRHDLPQPFLTLVGATLAFLPDERPRALQVRDAVYKLFASPARLAEVAAERCAGYVERGVADHPRVGQELWLDGTEPEPIPEPAVPDPGAWDPDYGGTATGPRPDSTEALRHPVRERPRKKVRDRGAIEYRTQQHMAEVANRPAWQDAEEQWSVTPVPVVRPPPLAAVAPPPPPAGRRLPRPVVWAGVAVVGLALGCLGSLGVATVAFAVFVVLQSAA